MTLGDLEAFGSHGDGHRSRIGRIEPRRAASAYVRGLLTNLDRKSCWNLAARWDADADADR
ncbi:hypothetical protein [Nonomuraea coxensis]|uniref:hypothetical protein n=1 Tax=Nonomuraea coxensis TaxID=404386 RepID=UPI0003AAD6D7|nr:hypothetical protein [Nonomuraea coxensis]